jgi:ssRNA-specific RNase YbeY (16S rRNA maturation enzyme)
MATDVLTFPVLSDTLLYSVKNTLSDFPVVLGDVFLCYDWACAAITMQTDLGDNLTLHQKEVNYSTIFGLNYYSMERLIHGWCHLSGLHHDTMTAYTQIVQIQRTLLEQIFSENI